MLAEGSRSRQSSGWGCSASRGSDSRGSDPLLYRGGLLACGLATAVVIAAAVHPERGPVHHVLSWRVLCWLGLISYGLYLWHWPLFVFLDSSRVHLTGWPLFAVQIAVTLVVSIACYRWIEQPIRRGTVRLPVVKVAVPAVAVLLVAVILWSTADTPDSFAAPSAPKHGGVMLVGNSTANTLAQGLVAEGVKFANRTVLGCSLLPGAVVDLWAAGIQKAISCGPFRLWTRQQAPEYVILVTGTFETMDVRPPGSKSTFKPGTAAFAAYYRTGLQKAIRELSSTGAVVIITTVPCISALYFTERFKEQTAMNPDRLRIENKLLLQVASRPVNHGRVVVADLNHFLCPRGTYQASLGTVEKVRYDGEHLSSDGANLVTTWLIHQVPQLRRAGKKTNLDVGDRIAGRLNAAGWPCSRGLPFPSGQPENDPLAVYSCLNGGLSFQIAKSRAALRMLLAAERSSACEIARSGGEQTTQVAHGDLWIVRANPSLTLQVAATLRAAGEKVAPTHWVC